MNTSADAADQVVKMSLETAEVILRLSGSGAIKVGGELFKMYKQQNKTKGAARLDNMLRSGKALKVYTFKTKDMEKFKEVAKQYGVLYTILKDKNNTGGVFDVFVRADDESKINRICERFNFTKVDAATLRGELYREKSEREREKKKAKETDEDVVEVDTSDVVVTESAPSSPEVSQTEVDYEEGIVTLLFSEKPVAKEEHETANPSQAQAEDTTEHPEREHRGSSPKTAETKSEEEKEESPLSEPRSNDSKEGSSQPYSENNNLRDRRSVREEIARIKRERAAQAKQNEHNKAPKTNETPKPKQNER